MSLICCQSLFLGGGSRDLKVASALCGVLND